MGGYFINTGNNYQTIFVNRSNSGKSYFFMAPTASVVPIPTPPQQPVSSGNVRYALASDTASITNANVGDLLILGGTETAASGLGAVYIGPGNSWTLGPGQKIVIAGGQYDFIDIYMPVSGSSANPIVITNYGSQVRTRAMSIYGMKNFKLTGRYDPANKTGQAYYTGHANGYAWTQGKYGIFVDNEWTDEDIFLLDISGFTDNSSVYHPTSDYEVEYIECANGGFSNVFKTNNETDVVANVKIHDTYFHDTGGEGIYLGNTSDTPQGVFKNLQYYNNRIIRAGNDGLQLNNIVESSSIYNNVVVNSGMNWRAPFMDYQDFGTSLSFNNGNVEFKNNVIIGAGGQVIQAYFVTESWYAATVTPSASIVFSNNLFLYSKNQGAYLGPYNENATGITGSFQNNIFGKYEYLYSNLQSSAEPSYTMLAYYNGAIKINNNTWEKTAVKTTFYQYSFSGPISNTGNNSGSITDIQFVNYMGDGFNYNRMDRWHSYYTVGINSGSAITFPVNYYVVHKSKMYKCLVQNSLVEPGVTAGWQTYWQAQTYNGGSYFLPADDVRIPSGTTYNTLGMGLLDNP